MVEYRDSIASFSSFWAQLPFFLVSPYSIQSSKSFRYLQSHYPPFQLETEVDETQKAFSIAFLMNVVELKNRNSSSLAQGFHKDCLASMSIYLLSQVYRKAKKFMFFRFPFFPRVYKTLGLLIPNFFYLRGIFQQLIQKTETYYLSSYFFVC